ncbi:MAG: TonB C-terminal domain-containing protein [Candidatus Gastranaerophilales bacterium]|nr:TonB C-terminal domain-containing protein [Candidatus Gastranaerophilales bacterium]
MFRCTECQTEYEVKPDFCDCGNDTFEEINPKKEEIKPEPKPIPKQEIQQGVPKVEYIKQEKPKKKNDFFEPVSTIFFVICVILSFIIVFFVGNPKDSDVEIVKTEDKATITKNIPNINTLWNNTPPKPEIKTVSRSQEVEQPVIPTPPVQQAPVQVQQPQPKIIVKQNYQPPKQQVVYKPQPIQQTKPQTQVKPKRTTQPIQQQVQQKQQTQPKTQPVTTQQTTVTKPQTVTPMVNKQELANYKIALRNKLAGKMNFANVIGDGTCVISFNISSNGALTNRKFQQQSDNFTLNDVVYNAVMQTPSFNPPPTGYKNETMRLTVKMYHGTFEVNVR